MDPQTAHLIVNIIAPIALVVWLAGLRFLLASAREPRVDTESNADEAMKALPIQGTVEVDGEPETLASRAASLLAKGIPGQIGPLPIVSRTADAVVFEGNKATLGLERYVRQGAIHFEPLDQGRTRIDFAMDFTRGKGLLWGGMIFQLLGLAAIVVCFWVMNAYVADSPNPAIRAQAVQILQVSHFLWPPFLFGNLYRKRYEGLQSALEMFLRNLPHYESETAQRR
jgi:hypothetical protein